MKENYDIIAGYYEEKKELEDICKLLINRKELIEYGGQVPKGLFLVGPNGVGKTILAKKFIKDSGCNCITIDCNDINGDDAEAFKQYIRNKFDEASKEDFSIIFIDEVDKLIGNSMYSYNPENFDKARILLNEVNKYLDSSNIFLLLVGNERRQLSNSLTRSGRINKIIRMHLPTNSERKEIIKSYISKNANFDLNIDIDNIVNLTSYASGARIVNILNESVSLAYLKKKETVSEKDIIMAYEKISFIDKEKETKLNESSLNRLVIHEAGHAAISMLLNKNGVSKITILNNGYSRGFIVTNDNDQQIKTLKDFENEIAISLAGHIAEKLFLKSVGDGSTEDIKRAKTIARSLVCEHGYYGLDKVTQIDYALESNFPISNKRLKMIEKLEDKLIKKNEKLVKDLLICHFKFFDIICKKLKERKTLYQNDIIKIIAEYKNT